MKITLTSAKSITRNHFDKECKPYGLATFEIRSGVDIPDKGIWELICDVRCYESLVMREMMVWINHEDGTIQAVSEINRHSIFKQEK